MSSMGRPSKALPQPAESWPSSRDTRVILKEMRSQFRVAVDAVTSFRRALEMRMDWRFAEHGARLDELIRTVRKNGVALRKNGVELRKNGVALRKNGVALRRNRVALRKIGVAIRSCSR